MPRTSLNPFESVFMILLFAYKDEVRIALNDSFMDVRPSMKSS